MLGLFNRNSDKLPSKPVVSTLTAAIEEIDKWTKSNSYHEVEDMDGLKWSLKVDMNQQPNITNTKILDWEVKLQYQAEVTADVLIKTSTLDSEKDSRLISIISNNIIPLSMKPRFVTASSDDEVTRLAAGEIPSMIKSLSTASLHEIKRKLIGRWVDQSCLFGDFSQ